MPSDRADSGVTSATAFRMAINWDSFSDTPENTGTGEKRISSGDVVPLTGINITKLDGTAKGGVIFNIADNFGIPIRYIGVGEGIDDLREFNADDFVKALFDEE